MTDNPNGRKGFWLVRTPDGMYAYEDNRQGKAAAFERCAVPYGAVQRVAFGDNIADATRTEVPS